MLGSASYGDEVKKTRRYVLAEELARRTDRLLLLTATPHCGDKDRFTRFLGLLDPDQFSTASWFAARLPSADSPYFLRRQKEDLRTSEATTYSSTGTSSPSPSR